MNPNELERRRLGILQRLNVLDTPPERTYDELTRLASEILGTPMAAVTLIDEARQWFKATVGIETDETAREVAFCDHTIRSTAPLIVTDAAIDERFRQNPFVTGPPHVRSYAGIPLRVADVQVGALCVIDTRARSFSDHEISQLKTLGRLVEHLFELRWRRQLSSAPSEAHVAALAAQIVHIEDFGQVVTSESRPAWLFDRTSLRFLAVNDSAVEQYGWSRDQFLNMTIADILPPEEVPVLHGLIEDGLHGGRDLSADRFWRHRRADDTEVRVQTTFAPVRSTSIDGTLVLVTDLTARDQGQQALIHAATHDSLTGLPNRAEFHRRVSQLLRGDPDRPLALLFVDLDGFKLVNDTAGHTAGDLLLAATSGRIARTLRNQDVLARMGGDEFAIACTGETLEDALSLARRVADSLKEPLSVGERSHYLTASIGISVGAGASTPEEMLIEADLAMLAAKASGRGTITVFDQELRTSVAKRAAVEHDLHLALGRNEFELYYQPIVALGNGTTHVEALLRWNHPTRGVLAPGDFLAVAEHAGIIVPIGSWVLREVAAFSVRMAESGHHIRVAFNLATQQLRPALVDEVQLALAQTGANARSLIAEVTESGLTTKEAGLVTRQLQNLGIAISIDDFGTGYSSLSRLRELDVDALKLDRFFVNELGTQHGQRMVSAIIQLAHALDLPVVAEGVETSEQLNAVRDLGCDHAQGYLFARPIPEAEIFHWLAQREPHCAP